MERLVVFGLLLTFAACAPQPPPPPAAKNLHISGPSPLRSRSALAVAPHGLDPLFVEKPMDRRLFPGGNRIRTLGPVSESAELSVREAIAGCARDCA